MLFRPLSEAVEDAVRWATSDHPRIGIGYSILDSRTEGGAAEGEVILFTARSQVGKTAFALNVVNNNPTVPTIMFSLEMHGRYIANRLAAIHTGTTTKEIEADLRADGYSWALEQMVADFPMLGIADKPGMSLKEMGSAIRDATEGLNGVQPRLVIMDYLELIGGINSLDSTGQVAKVARKVKDFAREHDVVVLCLHQVSRGAGEQGHEPLSISSGKFGGEEAADYLMGAYRPCLEPGLSQGEYLRLRDQLFLQFLKTRGGPEIHPAGLRHFMDPESMRIVENGKPLPTPMRRPYRTTDQQVLPAPATTIEEDPW